MYEVGPGEPPRYFTLEDNSPLVFKVQPSHPLLLIRVLVGDTLYKVCVCVSFEVCLEVYFSKGSASLQYSHMLAKVVVIIRSTLLYCCMIQQSAIGILENEVRSSYVCSSLFVSAISHPMVRKVELGAGFSTSSGDQWIITC